MSLYRKTILYGRTRNTETDFQYDLSADGSRKAETGNYEWAKSMLMIPDYFHFLLTGKKVQEYTNATTHPALVNPVTKDWDIRIDRYAWISSNEFSIKFKIRI